MTYGALVFWRLTLEIEVDNVNTRPFNYIGRGAKRSISILKELAGFSETCLSVCSLIDGAYEMAGKCIHHVFLLVLIELANGRQIAFK